jgi:lysophospholipase L1-like esterase
MSLLSRATRRSLLPGVAALLAAVLAGCSSGGSSNGPDDNGGSSGAGNSAGSQGASGVAGTGGTGATSASSSGTATTGSSGGTATTGSSSGTSTTGSSGGTATTGSSSGGAGSASSSGGTKAGGSSGGGAGGIADSGANIDGNSGTGGGQDAGTVLGTSGDGGVPLDSTLLGDCTGTSPITCTIPAPNGNYDVTVSLGSATAAATTRVQAELLRIELQPTATTAGMFFSYTFTVNVRTEKHNVYSAPGNILNLLFDGTAPALHGLGVAPSPNSITVFVAGDSTVCDWDPTASDAITPPTPSIERGWAQELSQYLKPGVAVANYAVSGTTSGGFYGSYFPAARTAMKAGDYLFVQFGHNDQKSAADIASYQANLTNYINDAKAKNVTPVIFTPVARGTGTNFAGLDGQARTLAMAQNVALVDLTNLSWAYYQTLPDKTVLFVPGQETHFTESGATQIAGLVANALKTSQLGLASYIK